MARLGCLLLIAASLLTLPAAAGAARSSPALSFVALPGYRMSVQGTGWMPQESLTFWVQASGSVVPVRLRTTTRGTFVVGISSIDLCGGSSYSAIDARGRRAMVRGPALLCPSRIPEPHPRLRVLAGRHLTGAPTSLYGPKLPRGPVLLEPGALFYIWEPGVDRPEFMPSADPAYLLLVKRGQTLAQDCSGMPSPTPSQCQSGFYWVWLGIRPGRTFIDLVPACRQVHQLCTVTDVSLEVRIGTRSLARFLR